MRLTGACLRRPVSIETFNSTRLTEHKRTTRNGDVSNDNNHIAEQHLQAKLKLKSYRLGLHVLILQTTTSDSV